MPGGETAIEFTVQVIVEPDEAGFHAYCPSLKGLHTCGDTEEEALRNASDAVTAFLRSLIKHGDPIPVGNVRAQRLTPEQRRESARKAAKARWATQEG